MELRFRWTCCYLYAKTHSSSVVLPLRFGKKPSGFGFVEYENEADAKNAVEKLNGSGGYCTMRLPSVYER